MIVISFTTSLLLTMFIVVASLRNKDHSIEHTCLVLMAGAIAFLCSFFVQMVLFWLRIEVEIINVTVEEILKVVAACLLYRIAKPVAVVAVFAAVELVVGKFMIPYLLDANLIMRAISSHGFYLLTVTSSAYVMHIITGVIYNRIGVLKGFIPAIILHFVYNVAAGWTDEVQTLSSGLTLLFATLIFVACSMLPWHIWLVSFWGVQRAQKRSQ